MGGGRRQGRGASQRSIHVRRQHRALFKDRKPKPITVEQMDEAIAAYVSRRNARRGYQRRCAVIKSPPPKVLSRLAPGCQRPQSRPSPAWHLRPQARSSRRRTETLGDGYHFWCAPRRSFGRSGWMRSAFKIRSGIASWARKLFKTMASGTSPRSFAAS